MSTIVPIRTPAAAPQPAAQRDWADDLADTILEEVTTLPKPVGLLAAHLRYVHGRGVVDGVARADRAVQDCFAKHPIGGAA